MKLLIEMEYLKDVVRRCRDSYIGEAVMGVQSADEVTNHQKVAF
jgi:hypothetical protein